MITRLHRPFVLITLALLLVSLASAHYHFVHFNSATSPNQPVYERFDLRRLMDNTLRYYISERGPQQLAPNDSFAAIVSQIRAAGKTWGDVETSSLRLSYGGIADVTLSQSTPGVDIIFDEIPPGLIAMGGPTSRAGAVSRDGEEFVPITRSIVVMNQDLSRQPSSSDGFFMTLVHEMGHALGLQHTFTSSVMSTGITRATTKAMPLGPDDKAGLSLLYPAPAFRQTTGVIEGRVVVEDSGVSLASVVALSPQGTAISSLTRPDGTYRIEGVPAGQYYVYVHPLPPPVYGEVSRANLVMPRDAEGNAIIPEDYFETQFFPGVKSLDAASTVSVNGAEAVGNVDFFVNRRGVPSVHSVTTYSFPGSVAVPSGHLSLDASRRFLVAYGFGLSSGTAPTAGLSASVVGGSAVIPDDGLIPYAPDPRFVQINFEFNPFSGIGARHLIFTRGDELYVLPSGLQLSQAGPPSIRGVFGATDDNGGPLAVVVGERITERTQILFDGVLAEFVAPGAEGGIVVRPPAAPGNHRATVVALNPDRQSSWFLDGLQPPTYDYGETEPGGLTTQPSALPAGKEAMVEIRGINGRFEPGKTVLGFGSSDVVVRDYIVLDPTLILANVAVAADTPESAISVSAVTGIEAVHQRRVFQTSPADASRPSMHSPLYDANNGRAVSYIGKSAVVRVSSLPEGITAAEMEFTLNDQPAAVESIDNGLVRFQVPATLNPGPVVARLSAAGRTADALLVRVALAPPAIASAHRESGAAVSAESPVPHGELVQLRVTDLGAVDETVAAERLSVIVDGLEHSVVEVVNLGDGFQIVKFHLGTTVPVGERLVSISIDGRVSEALPMMVSESE
jgi:matrixin